MSYRPTDRFENWFITSLQTSVNDTTDSFRLNKALNVQQARLVINPFNEEEREIVKVTSVDGTLVYVERGDDNTVANYHLEGTLVVLDVIAADLNDLYADWSDKSDELDAALAAMQSDVADAITGVQDDTAAAITDMQTQVTNSTDEMTTAVNDALDDLEDTAFLAAHPIGAIFMSVDSANPGPTYGGTWVAWGSGRVPVGVDASQTEFDTVEETGGEKTHILTEAELAPHDHATDNGGDWGFSILRSIAGRSGGFNVKYGTGSNLYVEGSNSGYGDIAVQTTTGNAGSGAAHNNLQPYITVYMWKRTA